MALKDNLISYWKLEEASGNRADAHGSNTLTDVNTVTQAAGKVGNAAQFTASNSEYLSITDAAQTGLDISGDFTINFWAYWDSLWSTMHGIVDKWATGDKAYQMFTRDTGNDVMTLQLSSDGTTTDATIDLDTGGTEGTGVYKMYTITYDASTGTAELFINGSSVDTTAGGPASIYNSGQAFHIGEAAGVYTDGRLDEFSIHSRILTNDEITEIYNSGNGLSYDSWDAGATVTPKNNLPLMHVG